MDVKRNKVIGSVLRHLRQENGLTQVQVAERLGRTQSMVSKVEAGERALPLVETWAYSAAIGTDPTGSSGNPWMPSKRPAWSPASPSDHGRTTHGSSDQEPRKGLFLMGWQHGLPA